MFDELTMVTRRRTPVVVADGEPLSWWVGLAPALFYEEARRRYPQLSDSTFGTWSHKAPTAVSMEQAG